MSILTPFQQEQLGLLQTHRMGVTEQVKKNRVLYQKIRLNRYISSSLGNAIVFVVEEAVAVETQEPQYLVTLYRSGTEDRSFITPASLDALLGVMVMCEYEPAYGASRRFFIDDFITEL